MASNVLRISEVYTSVQGEGPRVGQMTQFVRFAGCNLRCPGWPCDTQHAINPGLYRDEWKVLSVDELIETIAPYPKSITLTGGEPFLQDMLSLELFVTRLFEQEYEFDCFTNGTILIPDWARNRVNFILDWKLEGSGETLRLQALDNRQTNAVNLRTADVVKFTVMTTADLAEALSVWIGGKFDYCQYYLGRVWESNLTDQDLVDFVLRHKLPWKLNIQLHKYIWESDKRGI